MSPRFPEVAQTKKKGLREFYGIDDERGVSFFTVHESADPVHRQSELRVLNGACESEALRDEAVTAAAMEPRRCGIFWTASTLRTFPLNQQNVLVSQSFERAVPAMMERACKPAHPTCLITDPYFVDKFF